MHYLITGGCGFIGSHLTDWLIQKGHRVTVLDDLSTGKRQNIPAKSLLLVRDITAVGAFDDVVTQVDGCFHLAAIVSVQRSAEEWLKTHQVNAGGTVALFDALLRLRRNVPVVLASSAAVYGNSEEVPLKETARCRPFSAYGADKLSSEQHALVASAVHGIPAVALRFFNVYGTRQDPASPYSGVISVFMDRMRAHQPVTIYGDGEQSRDFIHVSDVVAGLALSMQRLEEKQLNYGVFNLCTGVSTSINALAEHIRQLTKSRSTITHAAARTGDIRISTGDTSLSKNVLEFHAGVPLEAGLQSMLKTI